MSSTLLLDTVAWDLVVDSNGNIAVASDPYSLAQDAASAIRTFLGEVYYDTTIGVPYSEILGEFPPIALLKQQLVDAALTVPGVLSAQVFISAIEGRTVSGQVQITSSNGQTSAATFSSLTLSTTTQSSLILGNTLLGGADAILG